MKLNSKQLRKTKTDPKNYRRVKRNPIYFVLDNVLDTYNIGSIFRLADAVAAEKIYICGDSEYPPSSRIHKAAVGTESWVPWKKMGSTLDTVKELRKNGVQIISIEQSKKSIDYKLLGSKVLKFPVALVVGHETNGVSKDVVDSSDLVVEFPMYGINKSFNVWGSAAIVAYKILECIKG